MTYNIMLQSTLSGSGKSLIAAAICRYFHKRGYEVSPFKSLNISLNSYITPDGREIGMSQAFQSWACGKEPCHQMNPILLKATGNRASQAIVNGVPRKEFERHGKEGPVTPILERAYRYLEERNDIIVIEGSGTPSEINLNDIANMNTAELFKSPVILIGDIDTGGVFAGLYGTYQLLSEEHKRL
nr:AAA family ATPase [Candidatus Methanofastidiosa archaeon]